MTHPTRAEFLEAMTRAHYNAVNMRIHGHVYPTWEAQSQERRDWFCSDMSQAFDTYGTLIPGLPALLGGNARVVPVEPVREMWAAGANAMVNRTRRHHDQVVRQLWDDMLAASPYASPTSFSQGASHE